VNAAGLELHGLDVGYPSGFCLSDVSFSVQPASIVGLIGPNGSGKSTLLKTVAGVLRPREGTMTLDGRQLARSANAIAFVPQREDVNWDFPVTALDVVLMGRYRRAGWFRRPGPADRAIAQAALARLGLDRAGGDHISQFSGGQQQRIFLARAIAQEPRLVLLDEPFTGVDVENRAIFHDTIKGFADDGAIVLIATHDLDEVTAMCTHVCCINREIIAFGPTAETYTAEVLRQTFGGQVAVIPGAVA
jgi:manganese/zinc/iron transport system ATP- binding protein